jgi:hypothetical protein
MYAYPWHRGDGRLPTLRHDVGPRISRSRFRSSLSIAPGMGVDLRRATPTLELLHPGHRPQRLATRAAAPEACTCARM